jgi:hypothetical protein
MQTRLMRADTLQTGPELSGTHDRATTIAAFISRVLVVAVILRILPISPAAATAACESEPEESKVSRWFEQYKQAWEQLNAPAATSLFRKDAEYREDPFEPPLLGEKAIRQYWEEVARGQRNVRVGYEVLSIRDGKGIVRWRATFIRVPSGEKVQLEGIAEITLDKNDKCMRFREWWNRDQTR